NLRLRFQGVDTPGILVDEIQRVTPVGVGTFNLTFNGVTTPSPLDTTSTAAQVQLALQNLSSIGVGNVSVSGPDGGPWDVTFTNALGKTDINGNTVGLIPSPVTATANVTEFRKGGLQTLLPFTAGVSPTAAQVQAHLLSLAALNPLVDTDN